MTSPGSDDYRGLGWAHGALTIQRLGAMLAPVTFVLADGRQVSPLHIAPWADAPGTETLPGIVRKLRGEWPCVPFGYSMDPAGWPDSWARVMGPPEPDEEIHGHCANHHWTWAESDGRSLALTLDYPAASPVAHVARTVTPDATAPAIDIQFTIVVRRPCRLPIGLHPVFALPAQTGAAELELGRFGHGRTYPADLGPWGSLFAKDRTFSKLSAVPAPGGGTVDASRLPFATATEELLQIEGLDGVVALANHAEGYRVRLSWQTEHFPSLLLWISNRARTSFPWNGRHLAIGIEPICSPFGLAPATAGAANPIAQGGTPTTHAFMPGQAFTTRYRIEAMPL
jgi:hypothetical protein